MKSGLALVSLVLALAGCGEGSGGNSSAPATPVAAAAPPAGRSWTETVSVTSEGGYVMGNPNAPIKLVEYGARSCPACGAFSRAAATPLEQQYVASGKVSFEFRDFLVHGAQDLSAALLGQCGGTQSFFPILDQMYQQQDQWTGRLLAAAQADPTLEQRMQSLPPPQVMTLLGEATGLIDFVKQRGIPEAKARACLADTAKLEAIAEQTQEATASGRVTGTPTFYLNGDKVDAVSWPDVEAALKRAGA